jgi:hypothetical protein
MADAPATTWRRFGPEIPTDLPDDWPEKIKKAAAEDSK